MTLQHYIVSSDISCEKANCKNIHVKHDQVQQQKKRSFFEEIFTYENLKSTYEFEKQRRPTPGIDHQTAYHFSKNVEKNIHDLLKSIHHNNYHHQPYLCIDSKQKKKPIFITSFRDRIVQKILVKKLSYKWEKIFSKSSYAFRPGISHQQAQKKVLQMCQTNPYIAIIDIKRFFESISHEKLKQKLNRNLKCSRTVNLIMHIVQQDENCGKGLVRGAIISPLLSNFYMNDFDWQISQSGSLIRYCDDMAILGRDKRHLKAQIKRSKMLLKNESLKINWWKKQISRYDKGFKFLGTYFKKV